MFCCFVGLVSCWSHSCCIVFPNSPIQSVDVQMWWWSHPRRSRSDGGTCGSLLYSALGTWEKKCGRLSHDKSSTKEFALPSTCLATNQKSKWAAKNMRMWTKCMKCESLLYVELRMWTTAKLSTENWTKWPFHWWPNIAAVTTTGISSLAAIGRAQRRSGHLSWIQWKPQ